MIQLHSTTVRPPGDLPRHPVVAGPGEDAGEDPSGTGPAREAPDDKVAAGGDVERAEASQIRELESRDREVRQHERAHAAAAAGIPHSAPSFTYTRGPDGQLYATGGEVQIDTSPVPGDPQATIDKARQIQRAALAPAEPSAQDRAVAARAAAMAAAAQAELQQQQKAGDAPGEAGSESSIAGTDEVTAACAVCGAKHSASVHLEGSYGELGNGARAENSPGTAFDAVA